MADAEEARERPIATRVLFEDDDVRIWDQVIDAGETLERHRHSCDYVLVSVRAGGPIAVEFHDGTGGALGERIELPRSKRGDAIFVPKGHVETATNTGDSTRLILIELKQDDQEADSG